VTHIAPGDASGCIIDEPMTQEGCLVLPTKQLGLCCSAAGAAFSTTTEVYPDSPRASDEQCNRAQVAAVSGALDYLVQRELRAAP
jgi:hypothetical protein